VIVSYTQRRTETVIYSPLKSRPALLLNVLNTSCYVYLPRLFYEWCNHSSKTDLLSIWSFAKYKNT